MLRARPRCLLWLCLLVIPTLGYGDIVCDGIDDILTTTIPGSTFITVSDATAIMTLKHAGVPSSGGTCGRDQLLTQHTNNIWQLVVHATNGWAAHHFDGTTDCASGTFSTAWTTLVWRHAGGFVELYINGALAQSTASGNSTTLSHNLALCWNGVQVDGPAPITVAQVAFYNTGLSANQIAASGNSFVRGLLPSGATAVWDFQDCVHGTSVDTQVFPDRTGNGRTITADNGTDNLGMSCAGSTGMVVMGGVQ